MNYKAIAGLVVMLCCWMMDWHYCQIIPRSILRRSFRLSNVIQASSVNTIRSLYTIK